MIELSIIKAFIDNKEIYNKYIKYIDYNKYKDSYILYYKLYYIINLYYTKYKEKENISIDTLETLVKIHYPRQNEDDWKGVFTRLREINVDADAMLDLLEEERKRSLANQIAMLALEVSDGKKDFGELQILAGTPTSGITINAKRFISDDLDELFDSYVHTKGLRWRVQGLNKSLGSLRKSDFGFVFARVETGKTAFVVSEFSHMARQTEQPSIYFCNEEDGRRIMSRIYSAHFGKSLKELGEYKHEYSEKFKAEFGDKICIMDEATMHRKEIEAICRELNPGLIVLDQLDKVRGFTADRYDLQMKGAYQWGRELAKQYCPVIGVCQASASADEKKWISLEDIDSSKTAKPGEADWVIGIGALGEYPDLRYLNILKNKLSGDEDTDETMRHARIETMFWPEISRYTDIRL